jgi:hypothetical protein
METREILLKAEKGTLSWERIDGGKIRFKTSSWDNAVVTTRSQVLEIAMVDHLPALVKATKPIKFEFRDQGWAMETREVLLKADKVSVVFDDARAPAAGIVGAGDRGERGIVAESN